MQVARLWINAPVEEHKSEHSDGTWSESEEF